MNMRKEVLLSSQMEGTRLSFSELLLFKNEKESNVSISDVEEVSNCVAVLNHGIRLLNKDNRLPITSLLIRKMHAILLQGGRGTSKRPGEFRASHN